MTHRQMKFTSTFSLAIALALITSCKQATPADENVPAQKANSADEVHLTAEQVKAIGLVTATATPRNLKTGLKANGRLVLPPQNQALVSVLMGGLVKDITVQEGEFVEQGKSLASLETISSTPSSATPSLSINKSNL